MTKTFTKDQFREQWEAAQMEITLLVERGIELQNLLPRIYEGVLGEEAPSRVDLLERRVRRAS